MDFTYLLAYLRSLKQRIVDRFTPNAGQLVASLSKLETQIERSVDKSNRELNALHNASLALARRMAQTNADLDATYKLLHKVSEMTR